MKYFKRLFKLVKSKKGNIDSGPHNKENSANIRYKEDTINEIMLDGALRMLKGYFESNKIKPKIKAPINHPMNLDQTVDEGFGFQLYCKTISTDKTFPLTVLATAFNHFLIEKHCFQLYEDSEPEYPLRVVTLIYKNQNLEISVYPLEYTAKVLKYEATFEDLNSKILESIAQIPNIASLPNEIMK